MNNKTEFFDTPGDHKLTIIHLYPDLMNIYGDRGNIIALKQRALWRNIDVAIVNVSIGDKLTTGLADIYFFGGGQDSSQIAVAHDLPRLASTIKKDIENGACALTICGGYQLFGHFYKDQTGKKLKGISIFDAYTVAGSKRMIGNIKIKTDAIVPGTEILGFENHSGQTFLGKNMKPLGKVLKGYGNNPRQHQEGVIYKNAIGTYLHGSLLPKNPKLTDYLLETALKRKYPDFELAPLDDKLEEETFREANSRLKY